MNVLETYKLLGELLKERPELANKLFIDGTYGQSPATAYLDNREVTILAKPRLINITNEVIVWQSN